MADLIDRQEAFEALRRAEALVKAFGYSHVLETISELSSADAVAVVRCKDCKYASPNGVYGCRLERFSEHDKNERLFAEDYCSLAERREE